MKLESRVDRSFTRLVLLRAQRTVTFKFVNAQVFTVPSYQILINLLLTDNVSSANRNASDRFRILWL